MDGLLGLPEREEEFNSWRQVMDSNEKWLSVKEVSGRLGWSVDTIRRLVDRGHMKAIVLPCRSGRRKRVYRSMRICESEIERCIRALQV
jgi:excisionase family DNA binding protein